MGDEPSVDDASARARPETPRRCERVNVSQSRWHAPKLAGDRAVAATSDAMAGGANRPEQVLARHSRRWSADLDFPEVGEEILDALPGAGIGFERTE